MSTLASGTSDITADAPAAVAAGLRATFAAAAALILVALAIVAGGGALAARRPAGESSDDARSARTSGLVTS